MTSSYEMSIEKFFSAAGSHFFLQLKFLNDNFLCRVSQECRLQMAKIKIAATKRVSEQKAKCFWNLL